MMGRVAEGYGQDRISYSFNPTQTAWHSIHELLAAAGARANEAPLVYHLIGATLALVFPQLTISNDSYSTSDFQSGSHGDFMVGDTVFHVTVAPTLGHYEKCRRNLQDGFKVSVLVPDRLVMGTKQNTEGIARGRISVTSIESFVSQNLEELAAFSKDALRREFRQLFDIYNARVDAIETDKSFMIEIPPNL